MLVAVGCLSPYIAHGQSVETDLPEGFVAPAPDGYVIPDLGPDIYQSTSYEDAKDRFSFKLGLAVLGDFTSFSQDAPSVQQVGIQEDDSEFRSFRLSARGHFELWRRWNYMFSYEYKGFDQTSEANWNITDASVATDFDGIGTLTIGKIKEPFAYEMVGDAANLPHTERLLSPFFVSRNTGVKLSNTMPGEVGTWSFGVYNNWLSADRSFGDAGISAVGRLTWLPVWAEDNSRYLHLGASFRYHTGDGDVIRMRGRPASNVADYYVDTGNLDSDHAWNLGLEALWADRGWSLLGEYVQSQVSLRDAQDAKLEGWYLTGSWVPTGENRPYDRKAGYARRVHPTGRWGALELIARVGRVDLDDAGVSGGTMDGWWAGVNWWATRRWKASITYGNVDLERAGLDGNTRTVLYRLQWIY